MPRNTRTSRRKRAPDVARRRAGAKALRGNHFLALVDTVRTEVDVRLESLLDAQLDEAERQGPEVVELVRGLRDLTLRGGKRLRAALVAAGYRAASASAPLEPALDAGVAVELVQSYFLIHDDWMDGDDVRRGGPAVHKLFAGKYRSRTMGEYSAILAGDYGAALAMTALARVEVPAARFASALSAFARMQLDAVAGQQLDVIGRGSNVELTYVLKTGSYTVAGPLRLGALLAGGKAELVTDLERFAVPTGVAFQLMDDLLSAFGDPKETGKPFANDIRSGKHTLLMQQAFELARGRDRAALDRAWRNPRASSSDLRRAVDVLERCGARSAVEQRIQALSAQARELLARSSIPAARRRLLLDAVDILTARRS